MRAFLRTTLRYGCAAGSASLPTGCGALPNSRGWGQDATRLPGFARIKQVVTLAHFVMLFIHDVFLGLPEPCNFDVVPDEEGVRAQITWSF